MDASARQAVQQRDRLLGKKLFKFVVGHAVLLSVNQVLRRRNTYMIRTTTDKEQVMRSGITMSIPSKVSNCDQTAAGHSSMLLMMEGWWQRDRQ